MANDWQAIASNRKGAVDIKNPNPSLIGTRFRLFWCGGLYWTRTSDPIDVNDVLYQLSQQTMSAAGFAVSKYYHAAVRLSILDFGLRFFSQRRMRVQRAQRDFY